MIYDYSLSKIIIFSHKNVVLVDGTTQSVKQRLYSLRNYYRHDHVMRDFLNSCQITLIVNYPCNNRFELNLKIKLFETLIKSDFSEEKKDVEIIKLKKIYDYKINVEIKKKVSFDEPISNVLYLN